MKLLLDSSTNVCRVWIKNKARDYYFERELNRDMGRDILSFIKQCLGDVEASWSDIDSIGFFAGPGSFTGLRIGVTVLNTIADSLNIPIVAATNSDKSRYGEGADDWRDIVLQKLGNGDNDKIATVFYGAEANITKPRK